MPDSRVPQNVLSPSLARLLSEGSGAWTFPRVWARMPLRMREEAVESVLESPDHSGLHEALQRALARAAGFRFQTVRRIPPAEAAALVRYLPSRRMPFPEDVLTSFMVLARRDLLSVYLDGIGVPHENGLVEPNEHEIVEPEAVSAAAEAALERFPPDDLVVYLLVLRQTNPKLARGVGRWLEARFDVPLGQEVSDEDVARSLDEGQDPDTPEPEITREARRAVQEEGVVPGGPFTALDRTLIRAAVDALQRVPGAADLPTLEDMVQEVVELNSSRHSSFFHRGFVDALTRQAYREELPAENPSRRSWYLVGWLSGLARRQQTDEIVAVFDENPHMEEVQRPGEPWAALALPLLFDALCRVGREPEGVRLLPAQYLLSNPTLLPKLLREGTRLLRQDDAERARSVFDRLGEVVDLLEAGGERVTERFFLEARRRRAHCYRQLGEAERARELLLRLLDEEGDPDVRAMVLADLGLLDSGFRSLAEVRLWRSEAERNDFLNALERGSARFEEALETGSRFASHGAWPLAVHAMAQHDWSRARERLSLAVSRFLERPSRYGRRKLLARVKIASGISEAMVMDYTRMSRARDLLEAGLEEGARIPRPLLPSVLAALDTHEEDLAAVVLARVLDLEGPEVLEELGESDVARRTPAVATHLLAHAKDRTVNADARARALRRALPILLSDHPPRTDLARQALDQLEELAQKGGVGWEEFLAILSRPEQVDPAWEREDAAWARIGILEARERYDEAIEALRERLAEILANPGWGAEEEAAAVVARARSYGLGPEWTKDLESRLAGWKREFGEAEEPSLPSTHPNQPYRILIVGGDERQHELKDRVLAHLEAEGDAIRVEHIPTGWSGNWSKTLDEALSAAERHDAVVLLQYMRTEFGRSLRAALECPWVSCPGVGTKQVARMVRKAAVFAAGRRA